MALIKVTYNCPKCIAGQLAFWLIFFLENPRGLLVAVPLAIFTAFALEKYYA